MTTDRAPSYPRVLDEVVPEAWHVVEQYANNPIEADHRRLKARTRPMRGLKRLRCAHVICSGHAFIQNLRRGHYELGLDVEPGRRLEAISPNSHSQSEPGAVAVEPALPAATQQRSETIFALVTGDGH